MKRKQHRFKWWNGVKNFHFTIQKTFQRFENYFDKLWILFQPVFFPWKNGRKSVKILVKILGIVLPMENPNSKGFLLTFKNWAVNWNGNVKIPGDYLQKFPFELLRLVAGVEISCQLVNECLVLIKKKKTKKNYQIFSICNSFSNKMCHWKRANWFNHPPCLLDWISASRIKKNGVWSVENLQVYGGICFFLSFMWLTCRLEVNGGLPCSANGQMSVKVSPTTRNSFRNVLISIKD